jgi:hypothetical protein
MQNEKLKIKKRRALGSNRRFSSPFLIFNF